MDDFVLTISDSEQEVPDYDSSDDEQIVPKNAKVKKAIQAKKAKKAQKTEVVNAEDEVDENLNPDFQFSLDGFETTDNFEGWDFGDEEVKDSNGNVIKKDVDLDSILRRKGGLGQLVGGQTSDIEEEEEADDEDLAMDGFGMGAKPEESEEDEDEDEEEEEEEEEEVTELKSSDVSGKITVEQEDSAEQLAEFFSAESETFTATQKQTHTTFNTLNLSRPLLRGLSQLGYTTPSPIQSATIPMAMSGKDIVAGAVTGSGKTAAFMIPIIERLLYKPAKIASTRVIVLTPTRELAIQISDVGKRIGQFVNGLSFGLAVGGLNLRQQELNLKSRPDIVVATPGRFIDHIRNSPSFSVDAVEVLVIDEADRMLEEGFAKELTEILQLLPGKRQTLLYSATMNSKINSMIQLSLRSPVRIMLNPPKQAATGLVQEFIRIRKRENLKPSVLFSVLKKIDHQQQHRIVVFVARKEMCHKLRIILGLLGMKVSELHGGLTQQQRLQSVTDFKNLVVPILICTDLASRGLDIPKIEYVVNFDMPKSYEIYLHRVGRTARAGRNGKSISLVGESSLDRSIVKEAIKGVETQNGGKAVGRNIDWKEVESLFKVIADKGDIVEEVLEEEKSEKELLIAEMELTKSENIMKYKKEIAARPRRTWFETAQEKKQSTVMAALTKGGKKVNSRKRKADEVRKEEPGRSYKKTKNDRVTDQDRSFKKQLAKSVEKQKKKKPTYKK
ncbi:hypothetical protein BABINDRAFT_172659 [Babjeviella inositovora NRRL Y-12698]|uniref:ATP-dependent RNA helicase DRS1 n=1 Tax=Babjeviella inositovora NRRL Y-12698 TaxID=984486 RepID=A0A1E3QJQ7_9ASCO|nr:uncharacterized protein BABINDRAFT_172659 [Babjeviella inositovora NRRL Y-12698]ODQ77925.1 hypothetical protein BABINDRAFT_172659 [Babjeviella inositovora NRRL Y-12698]